MSGWLKDSNTKLNSKSKRIVEILNERIKNLQAENARLVQEIADCLSLVEWTKCGHIEQLEEDYGSQLHDSDIKIAELVQERDEALALAEEYRKTGNRVINYHEDPVQWHGLICSNNPTDLLAKRDLLMKAEAIRYARKNLVHYGYHKEERNGDEVIYYSIDSFEDYANQLTKQAEETK